ncbi:MAG: hypothetical protein Q7V57_17250 [Actinomycetota bacterium]|nr:hypothetical protein [Actinomycetota bacterium]
MNASRNPTNSTDFPASNPFTSRTDFGFVASLGPPAGAFTGGSTGGTAPTLGSGAGATDPSTGNGSKVLLDSGSPVADDPRPLAAATSAACCAVTDAGTPSAAPNRTDRGEYPRDAPTAGTPPIPLNSSAATTTNAAA